MAELTLRTLVDDLVEYVKKNPKCSISQVAKSLNILDREIVEKWIVVLEEFGVLSVSYSGFEGFLTFKEKAKSRSELTIDNLRKAFMDNAKKKNVSDDKLKLLWPKFISYYENDIRDLFYKKANVIGIKKDFVEDAWLKFKRELEVF